MARCEPETPPAARAISARRLFVAVAGAAVVAAMLASTSCGTLLAISPDSPPDEAGAESAPPAKDSGVPDVEPIDGATPEAGVDTGAARHLRVFALTNTWDIFKMHLADGGMMVDRRDSADLFCADEAIAAGLGDQFVAWMSVAMNGSDAITRLPTDADWSLPVAGGAPVLVFPSRAHIDFGRLPMVAIGRGASGLLLMDAEKHVWTATNAMGRSSGKDCDDWGIVGALGTTGRTDSVSGAWTAASDDNTCGDPYHLYCFGL